MNKLVAAWLCLAIAACAAAHKSASQPPAAAASERPQTTVETPHDEIERLSNEIAADQSRAVPVAPTPMSAGSSDTCKSVCDIKGTICKNSERICELAGEMPGDDWAAGKCTDAKQACSDATKRCDDCAQ